MATEPFTMPDNAPLPPDPAGVDEAMPEPQPVTARSRELAELEAEISRRLRSNQRFLDRFLDEDFVDDETDGDAEEESDDEEL